MFSINEDPAESTLRELGAPAEDGLCDGGAGEATVGDLSVECFSQELRRICDSKRAQQKSSKKYI